MASGGGGGGGAGKQLLVTTVAGNGDRKSRDGVGASASFHSPIALCPFYPDGNLSLIVADSSSHLLRRLTISDGMQNCSRRGVLFAVSL